MGILVKKKYLCMLPILSRQRMNLGISPGICTGILCLTCISGIYFGEKKKFFLVDNIPRYNIPHIWCILKWIPGSEKKRKGQTGAL